MLGHEKIARDIQYQRNLQKWSKKALAGRVLWAMCIPFFKFSPRIWWGYRRALLRLFGAEIGRSAHIYPSVRIMIPWNLDIGAFTTIGHRATLYALGKITIGQGVTISQGAHLCAGTHEFEKPEFHLVKAPITIGDRAWVCADAFIGPGVVVGEGAVAAARSVIVKNVGEWHIVGGNPGRFIRMREMEKTE